MNHMKKLRMMMILKMKNRSKDNDLLMVVDGSNLSYRSYHKFKNLKSKTGSNTGLIFGFLRLLFMYITRFQPNEIIVVFDTDKSKKTNFRNKLCKDYKGTRKNNLHVDYEDFNRQQRLLKKILKLLNILVVWDNKGLKHEADDYIAYLATKHPGRVVIISGDKDFTQLINKKVKIFNTSKDALIYEHNCKDIMGFNANQFADYLIIAGDTSDNVKGYYGIGDKKAAKFLDEFKSIKNFLSSKKNQFKGIDHDGLRDLYHRNVYVVNLTKALEKYPIKVIPYLKPKKISENKLYPLFKEQGLESFTLKEFIVPFKKLQKSNENNAYRTKWSR